MQALLLPSHSRALLTRLSFFTSPFHSSSTSPSPVPSAPPATGDGDGTTVLSRSFNRFAKAWNLSLNPPPPPPIPPVLLLSGLSLSGVYVLPVPLRLGDADREDANEAVVSPLLLPGLLLAEPPPPPPPPFPC